MRKLAVFALAALALSGCKTIPGQTLSYAERGARAAEIGYVASADAGTALVLAGSLDKAKLKDLDFKAYTGLIVLRAAFMAAEPTNATKTDYHALVDRSDRRPEVLIAF